MDIHALERFPQDTIDGFLASIPFYKAVKQTDQWQYDLILRHSRVIEYKPGEVVLEKGQKDHWLFFLLKGQLQVIVGDADETKIVNYVTPGEVFGDLAVLLDHHRTATIVSDSNSKKVMAFATDFEIFGELLDFRLVKLPVKLIYYRNTVHSLRWKLEMYRSRFPDSEYASEHRKIKLYAGEKDTTNELQSLDLQAKALAKLLIQWNNEFYARSINPVDSKIFNSL